MQYAIGGTSQGDDHRDRVFEGLDGHDIPGLEVEFEQSLDIGADGQTFPEFLFILRRYRGTVGKAHAQGLHGDRHRIGGKHSSTGPRARATVANNVVPFLVGDATCQVFAIDLVGGPDIDRFPIPATGFDGAAVDHEGRAIEPARGDETARHVFVATGERDERIVPEGGHDGFNGIGDKISRLQGKRHPVCPHGNSIADADGVEAHADHIGFGHAFPDGGGKFVQMHVAGIAIVPEAGNADLRLVHIGFGQAGGVQHRLRNTLLSRLGDLAAVTVEEGLVCGGVCHQGVLL